MLRPILAYLLSKLKGKVLTFIDFFGIIHVTVSFDRHIYYLLMKPSRRQTRKEFRQDRRSIERFASMSEAFNGSPERTPSRIQRLGAGVTHIAREVVGVFKDTLQEGRMADDQIRLEHAEARLAQGYSTEEDLATLRDHDQPVIIKMPWQR
jgi:hypothetical protein